MSNLEKHGRKYKNAWKIPFLTSVVDFVQNITASWEFETTVKNFMLGQQFFTKFCSLS